MLTASGDQCVHLWDTASAQGLGQFRGHNGSVKSVCPSPGGQPVFASGTYHALAVLPLHAQLVISLTFLWDTASAQGLSTGDHSGSVKSVCHSPGGQLVFIDACLERVYTSAGPPVGTQASDQP